MKHHEDKAQDQAEDAEHHEPDQGTIAGFL